DALQQEANLEVGIAVIATPNFCAPGKQRVSLIEQQARSTVFSIIEDTRQVFLGLTHPLRHDTAEVDSVEGHTQLGGDSPRAQGFPCAGRTRQQHHGSKAGGEATLETPLLHHPLAMPYSSDNVAQLPIEHRRQYDRIQTTFR